LQQASVHSKTILRGTVDKYDMKYLQRAISLARLGLANTSPNPHVGAVIVSPDGRIIGEGFHRRCGMAHAEVNAVVSVAEKDRHLLKHSTLYVTLEPCSHYGKTPPCAKMIIDEGIPNVVIGVGDPNPKVNGKGIEMLREAGVNVTVADGIMAERCRELDPRFMSRFSLGRPYITLKWAQSNDGYMASRDGAPVKFSTSVTSALVHKLRAENDVILTSIVTVISDNPLMDTRLWSAGRNPLRAVMSQDKSIPAGARILKDGNYAVFAGSVENAVSELGSRGYNSILVESGPTLLKEFISKGLFDEIRMETASFALGEKGGKPAPALPSGITLVSSDKIDGNSIATYRRAL